MARKLSRIARSVIWIGATSATFVASGTFAQSGIQVSSPAKQVVNPFAGKRQAVEPAPPIAVPPAETSGPKTYQNPFAGRSATPRYVTPRMQPGPLSRWHRTNEPPPTHADPRPVHAVMQDTEVASDESDLSGPLAVQQKRTALFSLPAETHVNDLSSPPDPASFERNRIAQPTWLVPDESHTATASQDAVESYDEVRAAAQTPIDPFEKCDVEEVLVSDVAPPVAELEAISIVEPVVELELPAQQEPVAKVESVAPVEPDARLVPATIEEAKPTPIAVAIPVAIPVTPPQPPAAPPTAEEYYAKAEHVAAEAASTKELVAVVQLCQRGIEARPDTELAAALRSLAAWGCNRSGEIESDRRRDDEALEAFELAIQWDPNCWLALHNRAVSRAQQGNLEGALSDFNRALMLNPGLAVAYRNRGELLSATGRTEEAAADYTTALAQLPQDAELYAMRGEAYHRLGDYDKALADLTQSIENAPHNAAVYAQRGNVHAERGDFERAIADFRQALAIDPQSAEAHRSLAWLLATCPNQQFRDPRQALASAEQAAQLSTPGDPFVLDALAAANANAGRFDRAVRVQQEAIVNVPDDFAAPFQERLALYQQGQPFRNGVEGIIDENVRAASLEAAPHSLR